LQETQEHIKYFVASCLFHRKFIPHFAGSSTPLTDLCRKSLPGRVVHCDTTRAAFDTLKAIMISFSVHLIPEYNQDAKFMVATGVSMVGIAGVLLQEDYESHLRPCAR
jgi:hypothetical protein